MTDCSLPCSHSPQSLQSARTHFSWSAAKRLSWKVSDRAEHGVFNALSSNPRSDLHHSIPSGSPRFAWRRRMCFRRASAWAPEFIDATSVRNFLARPPGNKSVTKSETVRKRTISRRGVPYRIDTKNSPQDCGFICVRYASSIRGTVLRRSSRAMPDVTPRGSVARHIGRLARTSPLPRSGPFSFSVHPTTHRQSVPQVVESQTIGVLLQ